MTAPLILDRYHVITPITIVANPVVWLPLAGALLSGCVVLLLALVSPAAASLAGGICRTSLDWLDGLICKFVKWPLGYFWSPAPPQLWLIAFYVGFAARLLVIPQRASRRTLLWLAVSWMLLGGFLVVNRRWTNSKWAVLVFESSTSR